MQSNRKFPILEEWEILERLEMKICLGKKYEGFAVRWISLKSLINTGLDSYSSHSKDIVGEVYAFMIFHPFFIKKLDISVIPFCMQSIIKIYFNV